MDERHWWIAQKIAQTFGLSSTSGFLEKFICEPANLEIINNFLCTNGNNKLFFYCTAEDMERELLLHCTDNLLKLPRTLGQAAQGSSIAGGGGSGGGNYIDKMVVLYFLRHDTIQEISLNQNHFTKEIFCGEIKNISQILANVYNDFLFKLFESNKDWGNCNEHDKSQLIRNMGKLMSSFGELAASTQNINSMVDC